MTKPHLPLPERVSPADAAAEEARRATLRQLFRLIARAGGVEPLRSSLAPALARHFGARRAALMLFDEMAPEQAPLRALANPVVRYLRERHAPVHEALVMAPEEWSALCPWSDHGHVLCGPIVREGELIGALGLTRSRDQAAFDEADLADASALCAHLCAWFARWSGSEPLALGALTPRERQISELVAQGLTNAQIGARLCISGETVKAALKNIFRKANVRSRAQLAALQRG